MNVIFMGTPDFACPSLDAINNSHHNVVAVITQPDRLKNKGELLPCAVKELALKLGLDVYQYEKVSIEGIQLIKEKNADIIVTAAFGQILSDELLSIPKYGVVNVHGSILPKYRGASPIQSAILNGEKQTGITIMKTAKDIDSGDIIYIKHISIGAKETAGELFDRMAIEGGSAIVDALDSIENGTAKYIPQNHKEATFCKQLKKEDGKINWNNNYEELDNFVRGMTPWPSAYCFLNSKRLKVLAIDKFEKDLSDNIFNIGQVVMADNKNGVVVKVKDGSVRLTRLQYEGSKAMNDIEFVLGRKIKVGDII